MFQCSKNFDQFIKMIGDFSKMNDNFNQIIEFSYLILKEYSIDSHSDPQSHGR